MMHTHEILHELSFYLIQPNIQLLEMLPQYPDGGLVLSESRLWANSADDAASLSDEDQLALVKLIFLVKLQTNIDYNTDPQIKELGGLLLGSPPFRTEIFDRWWDIEKIRYNGNVRVKAQSLSVDLLQSLAIPDRPDVENWIQRLIHHKQEHLK